MDHTQRTAFIDGVIGLSAVQRFHGHQVLTVQTVADHSARVSMLAHMLAMEFYNGDTTEANTVAVAALFHDFSESILKNDVNSTVKSRYNIRETLKKLECDVIDEIFDTNKPQFYNDITHLNNLILERCPVDDHYSILKMADTCDFGLYVYNELMLGNSYMRPLLRSFREEYIKYPEYLKKMSLAQHLYDKIVSVE